jgi:hypothetical protein
MASPIKETPIVYGKNAIKILKEIENVRPLPEEHQERIRKAIRMLDKRIKNSYEEAGLEA